MCGSIVDLIYTASRCFLAECKAMNILNYAENSRFMVEQKLAKRGFLKDEISKALDYLETQNFLSDARFAKSYLRSRLKRSNEGKKLLLSKLLEKGVSYSLSKKTIDETFKNYSEKDICMQALEKQLKKKVSREKVYSRLLAKGFSYASIKAVLQESLETINH